MKSKPLSFASKELMLLYAKNFIKHKFGHSIEKILNESKLLKELSQQKKLRNFI
jgi:hypothetical protein